jgi:hypothetical protein
MLSFESRAVIDVSVKAFENQQRRKAAKLFQQ